MAERFTPGPWTLDRADRDGSLGIVQSGYRVASAHLRATDNPDEQKANARLIAAAPELYQALADLVDLIRFQELRDGEYVDVREPLALLARVQGEG